MSPNLSIAAKLDAAPVAPRGRISALDFTKGALVFIMVLYHWLNYFDPGDPVPYRYLRFLTPSFIFITGFLVSQVYFSKYARGDRGVTGRLLARGLKLLAIVAVLNVVLGAGAGRMADHLPVHSGTTNDLISYALGTVPMAFAVLVPIAYLLILSAILLNTGKYRRYVFNGACLAVIAVSYILDDKGVTSGYLDLLGIGLLGISLGFISLDRITAALRHPLAILALYVVYLVAIIQWNVIYPLQILAVCINLAALYWMGTAAGDQGFITRITIRLGKYSLFAYIAQIVILNLLRRLPWFETYDISTSARLAALPAAALCMILSVEALDHGRTRLPILNRAYTAVFS